MMKTGLNVFAHEIIVEFNDEFLEEIVENAELANDYQARTMVEYMRCCKDVGLEMRGEIRTIFQDISDAQIDRDVPRAGNSLLNLAREDLAEGRWVQSITLLGEALSTLPRHPCSLVRVEVWLHCLTYALPPLFFAHSHRPRRGSR